MEFYEAFYNPKQDLDNLSAAYKLAQKHMAEHENMSREYRSACITGWDLPNTAIEMAEYYLQPEPSFDSEQAMKGGSSH